MPPTLSPYLPLAPGQIRLLLIHRGFLQCSGNPETFLKWEFVHTPLDGATPYLAVSYVWGPKPATTQLSGDSCFKPVRVTMSALQVLQHLAEQYAPPFHVWIDALCIDQDNLVEKRAQLPRMREIYGNAVQVIAWLGETLDWYGAFEAMDIITFYARGPLRDLQLDPSTPRPYSCQCERDKGRTILSSLHPLLELEWFFRIWIVQEVVKGSCVLMVCKAPRGAFKELLWDDLYHYLLDHNILHFATDAKVSSQIYASGNACILAGRRHVDRLNKADNPLASSGNNTPLQTLLTEAAPYFDAKDPRDKIYALLGLPSDISFNDLAPAYTVPVESVFTETGKLILTSGKSASSSPLALLSFAGIGTPRHLSDLPTWVPDWTAAARRIAFHHTLWTTEGTCFGAVAELAGYDATSGVAYKPPVICNTPLGRKCLALRGIVLDRVRLVGSRYPLAMTLGLPNSGNASPSLPSWDRSMVAGPTTSKEWLTQARRLANSAMSRYYQSVDVLLARTLTGDMRQDYEPWSSVHGTTCVADLERSHEAFFRNIGEARSNSLSSTQVARARAEHFVAAFERHGADRVLFTTGCGYLGIGAEGVKTGDCVVLLCGGRVPFLLRPVQGSDVGGSGNEFQLVSECYVRGIMHGEAVGFGVEQDIVLV